MIVRKEVWQRGPVKGVPSLLQPVAHALLEVSEEVHIITDDLPEDILWMKPAGVASPAFHLQHITGVIDRLFTYARKEPLSKGQMQSLLIEGVREKNSCSFKQLTIDLDKRIAVAIDELKAVSEERLADERFVGRKQIPTTLIGLYFHAAEHSMRHVGQLLVTVKVLKEFHKR